MSNQKLKQNIKAKIDDINSKVLSIRERLSKEENPDDELQKLLLQLEKIQTELTEKFDTLEANPEADWDEFDKNIHQSMKSFNQAFTRAGTLFKNS
ncbi:hypothetical protein [Salinivirga cyanobacteriivorans]